MACGKLRYLRTYGLYMLDLNDLVNGQILGITPSLGGALAEAGAVSLECKHHKPGVRLPIRGISNVSYRLEWTAASEKAFRAWQPNRATEWGAEGIAALLAKKETPYTVIEASVQGEGVDCWLGDESDITFQRKARMEVSGMRWNNPVRDSDIQGRVDQKLQQTDQSDHTQTPAYVVVVEFGRPVAEVHRK